MADNKLQERNIPGMNRGARFAEVEYAENAGAVLARIVTYFAHEKLMVISMLTAVIFGTLSGIWAPSLQSRAIDMIASGKTDTFGRTF